MSMPALVLTSVLLASCGEEEKKVPLSCEYDPHDWFDNPTSTLLRTEEGAFDFDPAGSASTGREGTWDAEAGEMEWTESYAEGFYLVDLEGMGTGTIAENGDLDLYTRHNITDVLGAVWAERYHYERTGCEGSTSIADWTLDRDPDRGPPAGSVEHVWSTEIVADDEIHARLEMTVDTSGGEMASVQEAVYREDVAMVLETHIGDGAYTKNETWQYDGTGVGTWVQQGEPYGYPQDYNGVDTYYFDGSWLTDFWGYEVGTTDAVTHWVLLYLYDGSAEGTLWLIYNGREYNCEIIIYDDGRCRAICEGGLDIQC